MVAARVLCCLTALCLGVLPAAAQDSHYWNIAYGTQATLLGGAVIGSAGDLSATFYNPGMLAVNREQGLLLGANVYTFQRLSVDAGTERSSSSSRLLPAPGLVAGRIPVDSTVLGGVAYSILTRQFFSTSLVSRFVGTADLLGADGIPEQVSSELQFETQLSETWVGATLFRLLGPGVGAGVTNYVAIRQQQLRSAGSGAALLAGGNLVTSARTNDTEYMAVRLLWKFGAGVDLGNLTCGLTVTTPSVHILGSGSYFASGSYNGVTAPGDSVPTKILAATDQEDLKARYASSWAIGAGLGYRFGDARVHLSAEWFAPVDRFSILETSPYTGQSDGTAYESEVAYASRSVVNAGLGMEYRISPTAALYASLIMDRSAIAGDRTNVLAVTSWDLYHVTAGGTLEFSPFDLTIGASYAAGSDDLKNVPWRGARSASATNLVEIPDDAKVRALTLTGVLAFTFKL